MTQQTLSSFFTKTPATPAQPKPANPPADEAPLPAAQEAIPLPNTNRRIVHNLLKVAPSLAPKIQRWEKSFIGTESIKISALTSNDSDNSPLTLDQISRVFVLRSLTQFCTANLSAPKELSALVESGILSPDGPNAASVAKPVEAPAPVKTIPIIDMTTSTGLTTPSQPVTPGIVVSSESGPTTPSIQPSTESSAPITSTSSPTPITPAPTTIAPPTSSPATPYPTATPTTLSPPTATPTTPSVTTTDTPIAGTKRPISDVTPPSTTQPESDSEHGETFIYDCDQIRLKIMHYMDMGEMTVTAFQKHLHVNSNSYGQFMKLKGAYKGINNGTYSSAHRFFRRREKAGLPIAKKAKPTKRGSSSSSYMEIIKDIVLPGEAEGEDVKVFDSCDEIRRKISVHMKNDDVTQAQFTRDLAAMFGGKLQSKQLMDFRGKKGPSAGNTSRVFYAAYVFFEKLRVAEGQPKTKHRRDMEQAWGEEGFDTKHSSGRGYWCTPGEVARVDNMGKVFFS